MSPRRAATAEQLPYVAEDRQADIKNGRRDGRKQIPTYTDLVALDDNAARITTPYQEQLIHAGLVRIGEEYEHFLARTAAQRDQLVRLRGQLTEAEQAVGRGLADVAAANAPLTADELLPRNHQERELDEQALRSRRTIMRERRIAAADELQRHRLELVDQRRREIDEMCGRIDREFAAAQAAGRRLGDYYVLRIATYWDALALAHPEGRHLAPRVPSIIATLPPWVDATCACGVVTLPPPVIPATQADRWEAMPL